MYKNSSRFIAPAKRGQAGKTEDRKLSVIVPVAGVGHRMKSYGPKCLLPLKNSTILSNTIVNIQKVYPHSEIIVVVGFQANSIIKAIPDNIRIVENQLYEHTNTIESLRLALNNAVNDNILIIHGDLIFNTVAIRDITMNGSCAIVDNKNKLSKNGIGATVVDNMVTNFSYGLPNKWAQIIFLTGLELNLFKDSCSNKDLSKLHTFEVLNMTLERGGIIHALEPKGMQITEVDSLKDLSTWDSSK